MLPHPMMPILVVFILRDKEQGARDKGILREFGRILSSNYSFLLTNETV